MADSQPTPESQAQAQAILTKRESFADGSSEVMVESLKTGVGTGAFGAFMGASTGILIGTRFPVAFTLVYSLQWFAHGTIYYGSRHMILSRHGPIVNATVGQKIEASSLAGAISGGTVIGLMRGRGAILPATIIGTLLGGGLQFGHNIWTASRKAERKSDSWLNSKWSPMKQLTDQEYQNILEEKLLRLDAEIAIIDDNVAELKAQMKEQPKAKKEAPETPPSHGQK